jgi:nucleoside-triphosphatase THEP1
MTRLVLLSAPRGAGKTTACQQFVALAREAGMRLGGILAPARLDHNANKVGIVALDVFTGEQRLLASIEVDERLRTIGCYRFEDQTLDWALGQVMHALEAPIDVVIVDEIGPLELLKLAGFAPVLGALPAAQATVTLLVVRTELLTRLQERLRALEPLTVTLTLANRDQIPARLFAEVWGTVSKG